MGGSCDHDDDDDDDDDGGCCIALCRLLRRGEALDGLGRALRYRYKCYVSFGEREREREEGRVNERRCH